MLWRPALAAVLAAAALAAPPARQVPEGTAVLRGRVVDAATRRGLARARVALTPPFKENQGRPSSRMAVCDADGVFEVPALAAGEYSIDAAPPRGYLSASYGAHAPGAAGHPIQVTDGGRIDVTLEAWPEASVAGHVVDTRGRPVVGASVRIAGRFGIAAANAQTDDRGEFLFTGLAPGEYTVGVPMTLTSLVLKTAAPPRSPDAYVPPWQPYVMDRDRRTILTTHGAPIPAPSARGPNVYVTSYYGGAGAFANATYFSLALGQARADVDIVLDDRPARRLSGTAATATGPAPGVVLMLIGTDTTEYRDGSIAAHAAADGSFVFAGVPEGTYELRAYLRHPPFSEATLVDGMPSIGDDDYIVTDGDQQWASMPLTVGAEDVTGLSVVLRQGTEVSGRIVAEDGTPLVRPGGLSVTLASPVPGLPSRSVHRPIASDGTFTARVIPGLYFLDGPGQIPGWSFQGARLQGRDLDEGALDVGEKPVTGVEIVYARGETSLAGTIVDRSGNPFGYATVIVFPADRRRWTSADPPFNPRTERPGSSTFAITGLSPGDYYVVATDESFGRTPPTPPMLQMLVPLASRVRLRAGEAGTLNLIARELRRP